jgi:tetratricopeptide (TPR) repeat protein
MSNPVSNPRLEILKQMVEQDPAGAFGRYGLAMEYVKAEDFESAMEHFRALLEHNPNYAAGYFHGGQTLEKMGRVEDAKALYQRGIEVTTASGDGHTRSELVVCVKQNADYPASVVRA